MVFLNFLVNPYDGGSAEKQQPSMLLGGARYSVEIRNAKSEGVQELWIARKKGGAVRRKRISSTQGHFTRPLLLSGGKYVVLFFMDNRMLEGSVIDPRLGVSPVRTGLSHDDSWLSFTRHTAIFEDTRLSRTSFENVKYIKFDAKHLTWYPVPKPRSVANRAGTSYR